MQEKLLCINNGKCLYILQGVPELSLSALLLYLLPDYLKMRSEYLFYPEGLLALPSRIYLL
jgi:hypothetical protein